MSETFKNVGEMLDYFAKEENIQERFVEKLMSAYPQLFPKDADGQPREPDCGAWCPVGWQPMVEELCSKVAQIVDEHNLTFEIGQIKEKFGGLRFYYSYEGDRVDEISDLIHGAEERSFKICEVTGEAGELRIKGKGYGWLKTLSDGEAGRQGYETLKEEIERE
jgi:hypothetical protein